MQRERRKYGARPRVRVVLCLSQPSQRTHTHTRAHARANTCSVGDVLFYSAVAVGYNRRAPVPGTVEHLRGGGERERVCTREFLSSWLAGVAASTALTPPPPPPPPPSSISILGAVLSFIPLSVSRHRITLQSVVAAVETPREMRRTHAHAHAQAHTYTQ